MAAFRTQMRQRLRKTRNINNSTEVKDVQLSGGRMIVYFKDEMCFEIQDQRMGWVLQDLE
jgi:hypothetical protein